MKNIAATGLMENCAQIVRWGMEKKKRGLASWRRMENPVVGFGDGERVLFRVLVRR